MRLIDWLIELVLFSELIRNFPSFSSNCIFVLGDQSPVVDRGRKADIRSGPCEDRVCIGIWRLGDQTEARSNCPRRYGTLDRYVHSPYRLCALLGLRHLLMGALCVRHRTVTGNQSYRVGFSVQVRPSALIYSSCLFHWSPNWLIDWLIRGTLVSASFN